MIVSVTRKSTRSDRRRTQEAPSHRYVGVLIDFGPKNRIGEPHCPHVAIPVSKCVAPVLGVSFAGQGH